MGSLALSITLLFSTIAFLILIVGCNGNCRVGVKNTADPNKSPNPFNNQNTGLKEYKNRCK